MTTEKFFDESKQQSQVKSIIVTKYFDAWSKVMIGTQNSYHRENRISYIDLFAGPRKVFRWDKIDSLDGS